MSLVWERAPYTAGSLIVLLALADWANDEGVAWPSMERLAQKARIDRRSAQRIVRQLEKDGVLEVEHGGGRAKQHKYVLRMETATFCRPLCAKENSDISDIETATFDPQRATFDAETATYVSPDPLEEPLVEPPIEPSEARAPAKKKIAQLSDEEFLSELEANPTYAGINVRQLNGRMQVWCAVNGKRPTRRRLVNWLNREDRPIAHGNGNSNGTYPQNNELRRPSAAERNGSQLMRNLAVVQGLRRESGRNSD